MIHSITNIFETYKFQNKNHKLSTDKEKKIMTSQLSDSFFGNKKLT